MPLGKFTGMRELVSLQVAFTKATHCCGVCRRSFSDADFIDLIATQLQVRVLLAEQTNASSKRCARLVSAFQYLQPSAPLPTIGSFRRAALVRAGALGEVRSQKQACMEYCECIACSRELEDADMATFLRMMDEEAARREEMLHVHINYSG